MKKLLLICSILMASCYFGEVEGIPEATKLSIFNNTTTTLHDVKWNGISFGDIEGGDLISKMVEPTKISTNISFKTDFGTLYNVREPVSCKSLTSTRITLTALTQVSYPLGCSGNCQTIGDVTK